MYILLIWIGRSQVHLWVNRCTNWYIFISLITFIFNLIASELTWDTFTVSNLFYWNVMGCLSCFHLIVQVVYFNFLILPLKTSIYFILLYCIALYIFFVYFQDLRKDVVTLSIRTDVLERSLKQQQSLQESTTILNNASLVSRSDKRAISEKTPVASTRKYVSPFSTDSSRIQSTFL